MDNIIYVSVYTVPPADRQQQTVRRQLSGEVACPEGQATGLSGARRASQSDSYRLYARAEGT